ncbi:uncharacterized protein LOC131035582 [Cryptomeria japonica]|uniref:uncharacterized protein LOC131035582 n=1 Tax=Cryptomeria japonica TaxID=3369 RepID=UPI0027DA16BB|nr:uncharacterized protein LOC131035582 [Cryptomeria japonica]
MSIGVCEDAETATETQMCNLGCYSAKPARKMLKQHKKSLKLGTWDPTGNAKMKSSKNQSAMVGYRHFDTARVYGSEHALGKALNSAFQSGLGMEQCMEMGLTKAIGVSNFSSKKIEDLLKHAKIPRVVDQVEMNPNWQQKKLRDYCSKHNIHVIAWSPLGAPNTP